MSQGTILIVDDTKSNLDVLIELLDQFDNIPVLDGKSAIDIARGDEIDLILLDIMMPDMNGFEVCKLLKEDPRTSKIPIIFLTAKNSSEDIEKGFEYGAVDYICKPFNPNELKSRVVTHLELRSYQKNLEKKVEQEILEKRANERLMFQKVKQAEMGELLMHIAHQWKQPLSELGSINTYNIAKIRQIKELDNEGFEESFNKISSILEFMSTTVDTFQDFYKPTKEKSFFNVTSAVDNAINIISATLNYNNISLSINRDENPEVYGSKNEYSQIILALLNNAKDILIVKKIKDPKIEISISILGDQSMVTISDNGGGIEYEDTADIFSPFVSGKEGLGIGLYMVKMIVEKNNGSVDVENINDGARFTILI